MKRVLNVGQCSFDHAAISRLIEGAFEAQVIPVAQADEALRRLKDESFDLVLVNRQFDLDGSPGLALIQQIKADPQLATLPVMMVTNYPEYQQQAVGAGAVPGFGKAELGAATTQARLAAILKT